MTREEIQKEYLKLLDENARENQEIIKNAKENGLWKPGLDANKGLFTESNLRLKTKIEELKNMVVEASE